MNRMQSFLCAALIAATGSSAMGHEIELDVAAYLHNGKIRTHGYSHDTGLYSVDPHGDTQVFAYNFDEGTVVAGPPNQIFLEHPGFNSEEFEDVFGVPTGFTPGSHLGIVAQTDLQYWDGTGTPAFGPAAAGTSIIFDNFGIQREVTDATFDARPFFVFEIEGGLHPGEYHGHITSILNDDSAPAGIYMIEAIVINGSLTNQSTGEGTIDTAIDPSDPIFFLFNLGLAEDDYEEAVEAYIELLENGNGSGPGGPAVPEPTTIALLAGSMLAFVRRSDRQRR